MMKHFGFLFFAGVVLSVTFLSIGGCKSLFGGKKDPSEKAFEIPDYYNKDGKPKLVGDCAFVGNTDMFPVHGYGLVLDLPGTGGEDINSRAYREVYEDMNRQRVPNIRARLADPKTAVVEITAYMRPGIQTGDLFDVQVSLPENSNTKNLRGGRLLETSLIDNMSTDGMQKGSVRAKVKGPIMVEDVTATETSNPHGLTRGTILSGAVATKPRALSLIMKKGSESMIMTDRIAKAINLRFPVSTSFQKGIADAKNDEWIVLEIHPTYANDVPRYVKVILSVACYEPQVRQIKRIERLSEELLNPETSQHAAFQLEAIGKAGIPPLQQALRSSDMEVRFHAATSLAYLGDGASAKILAEIAQTEPAFRIYALNALSVMKNDMEAEYYLRELLHVSSAETRYGAFKALKNRNPMDQTIRGEMLGNPELGLLFSHHGINTQAPPMVHITMQRHPEIVLFGTDIFLKTPFNLDAGPLMLVNGQTPNDVVVSKFVTKGMDEKRMVSNRLDEVIRAVVDMGGTYPDVVQLIRQAEMRRVLSCRLEVDCLPEPNRIYRRSGSSELEFANEGTQEEKPRSFWERFDPRNMFTPNPGEKTSDFKGTVNTPIRE